ncbi:MAG TPA: outer membrane protein assembly factor BamD [Pyrinomonadaceae bacterium]|jgi:outer membrane protein assembly factor BamD (BamD/ComL family)|nr:outer membrane protein assembly factor BamD [Pyrinomonadaceae bacterium]
MKKLAFLVFLLAGCFGSIVSAQRNVTPAVDRDPLLEADAKHNLDVAWQGFKPLKKAYKQVIYRFEETYAAYPEFSKIDEFLYIAGMSSYYLSDNKGRQKVDFKNEREKEKFAPDKLRQDAFTYLSAIVEKYPQSQYVDEARKTLTALKTEKWTPPPSPAPPTLKTKSQ